jgi:WD40-like Beta Propeller Repeat
VAVAPKSLLVDAQLSEQVRLFRLTLSGHVTLVSPLNDLNFSTDRARRLVATTHYTSGCGFLNCPAEIDVFHLSSGKVTTTGSQGDLKWLASAAGTGTPRQVAKSGENPIWSPDGRLLAYGVSSQNALSLEVQRPGGQPRTVAPSGVEYGFVFSPNTRSLAYDFHPDNGSDLQELEVVNLRTGRVYLRSPAVLAIVSAQAWSPNGKQLLVVARPGGYGDCPSLYKVTIKPPRWTLFRSCG